MSQEKLDHFRISGITMKNRIRIYVLTQRPSLNVSSKQIITNESHHLSSETKLTQETGTEALTKLTSHTYLK